MDIQIPFISVHKTLYGGNLEKIFGISFKDIPKIWYTKEKQNYLNELAESLINNNFFWNNSKLKNISNLQVKNAIQCILNTHADIVPKKHKLALFGLIINKHMEEK